MIKKISIIILAVAIIGALVLFIKKAGPIQPTKTTPEESNLEKIEINPTLSGQTLPLSNNPKDMAWSLFQKYLGYNKNKDVAGIKSVVYKISPACAEPKTRIDCEARMGAAYAYGSKLNKADFVNFWEDDKQAILSTDFKITEDKDSIGRSRAIIYFIKTESGLKLLSFSPIKGVVAGKGTASIEELTARLTTYTEDKDNDGIADYEEECLNVVDKSACTPTNPKSRDTDGNGFWDGVQTLIK